MERLRIAVLVLVGITLSGAFGGQLLRQAGRPARAVTTLPRPVEPRAELRSARAACPAAIGPSAACGPDVRSGD